MASTLIQFRIENDEKRRSSQILETMGLSLPGIPFSMKLDDRIPGEKTDIEVRS